MASDVHSESETAESAAARTNESGPEAGATGPGTAEAVESAGDGSAAASEDGSGRGRTRVVVLLCVAALALLIDVVSKMIVVAKLTDHPPVRLPGGFLILNMTRNPGAAFSIGQGQTWVFTIIAAVVVVVIVRISRNLRSAPWACALGLLLGGALGNLGDRIFREPKLFEGHVVDFLQFPTFPVVHYDFPVFNLADSAIVVGGCLMVLLSFLGIQPDGTRHVAAEGEAAEGADGDESTGDEVREGRADAESGAEAGTGPASERAESAEVIGTGSEVHEGREA